MLNEHEPEEQGASQPPSWHPLALVGLIVAVAATGILLQPALGTASTPSGSRVVGVYLPLVIVEWGSFLYVTRVAQRRGTVWRLLGKRWQSPRRALGDICLAISFACALVLVHRVLGAESPDVSALLPVTRFERLVWIAVACSVGICEELVYRGYLQSWFSRVTSSASLGIVLQALLFGLAHAEQGLSGVALAALYGAGLGTLAHARKSLIPGILVHVGIDWCAGWFP